MISVADLRTYLRLDTPEDLYDAEAQAAELEQLEAAAVDAVQRFTGRYFGPVIDAEEDEPEVVVMAGSGSTLLYLPDFASAVTAISSRGFPGDTETEIDEDADDGWGLRLTPGRTHSNVLVRHGGGHWVEGTEYVITATIGYEEGAEPPAIRQAVLLLASHFNENRVAVITGTIATEMPLGVKALLQPFVRMTA